MRRLDHILLLAFLAGSFGCGGDDTVKPPPPTEKPRVFVEPASFCISAGATTDSLCVHNLGDTTLTWTPIEWPEGSTALNQSISLEPDQIAVYLWTWAVGDTLPMVDSLVVQTNDPDRPSVVIPFRREAADYVDLDPPGAPELVLPADEAVFRVGNEVDVLWGRVSDCSGIRRYDFQIALDRGFQTVVLTQRVPASSATLVIEPGDEGRAFWRVRAVDGASPTLPGEWSEVRSWTVQ